MKALITTRWFKLVLLSFVLLGSYAVSSPTAKASQVVSASTPQVVSALTPAPVRHDVSTSPASTELLTTQPSPNVAMTADKPRNATNVQFPTETDEQLAPPTPTSASKDTNATARATYSYSPQRATSPLATYTSFGWDNNMVSLPRYTLKEAHYWSQLAYSRLRFEVTVEACCSNPLYDLYINLVSQDDIYCRTLRVYDDSINRFQTTICPPGFSTKLTTQPLLHNGLNRVELEIQWGFYTETSWKLLEFYVINEKINQAANNNDPNRLITELASEYFPKTDSVTPLTWQAKLGTDSKLEVNIQQVNDPYTRCLRVYVDGVMKTGQCDYVVPGQFTIQLGDYPTGLHWLKLEIKWGFYSEYGWRIDLSSFRVHYAAIFVQADYMPGMAPIQDGLNYIQQYYIDHGPERVTFFVTNQVSETRYLTVNGYFANYVNANPTTFPHQGDNRWKYVIFGEYSSNDGTSDNGWFGWSTGGGTPGQVSQYFFISSQKIRDCTSFWAGCLWPKSEAQIQKEVTMHEFGHSVGMIHNTVWTLSDMYTYTNGSNVRDSPLYAIGDWVNRAFP